jgi:glucose/arabinose dehydrogenase
MRPSKSFGPRYSFVLSKLNTTCYEKFIKRNSMLLVSLFMTAVFLISFSFIAYISVEAATNLTSIYHTAGTNAAFLSPQHSILEKSVILVWKDNSTGNDEIYLRKSSDGGITFGNATNISDNVGNSQSPQIQALGNITFVVWQDNSTGNDEIYLRKSSNSSTNFYDPKYPPGLNTQYVGGPVTTDTSLKVELVATGINFPTHMAFLSNDDILVLEKNDGTVKRVTKGIIQNTSLLDVSVANGVERGMLGIATKETITGPPRVFLYYTESVKDGDDVTDGKTPLGNRLYRYDLTNDKLVNPKLLLELPSTPDSAHNGGKILVSPEGYVYLTIGELNRSNAKNSNSTITKAQNHADGMEADGRAGILRITEDGKSVGEGIIGNYHPLDKYFAYGIRNSFGMAFDPLSGNLWDVENGPEFGDEINLVVPGFNSGWNKVQGIWTPDENSPGNITADFGGLYKFNNTGKYMTPALSWFQPSPGLTSIIFLNSSKLGAQYVNNLFVSDFHNGNIYNFGLNSSRTGLTLPSVLADKVVNTTNETQSVIFARGFGGITDIELGPDGYLYVLSIYQSGDNCDPVRHPRDPCISYDKSIGGTIFRIMPRSEIN